ncbi:hypothetical protein [Deinococcus depolymerans]
MVILTAMMGSAKAEPDGRNGGGLSMTSGDGQPITVITPFPDPKVAEGTAACGHTCPQALGPQQTSVELTSGAQ